jgi:hypothetical protein
MNKIIASALALCICFANLSIAEDKPEGDGPTQWFHLVGDEYFHIPVQDGWRAVWADPKSGEELVYIEFLPEGQDLPKWEDMLTIQIFPRNEGMTGEIMINQIAHGFKEICKEHVQTPNFPGDEKGIKSFQAILGCEWQPEGYDKPLFENLYLRVFETTKAIYVQQRSWRKAEYTDLFLAPEVYQEDLGPLDGFILCSVAGDGIPVCPVRN